jgi:hypothetical protein
VFGILFLIGFKLIKVTFLFDVVFVSIFVFDVGFYEDAMRVLVSYKSDGIPLQIELIKKFGDDGPRSIIRSRIVENGVRVDLGRYVGLFTDGYFVLGDSGYTLKLDGTPMSNCFHSIIYGHGSYDCIMFGDDWKIDDSNKVIRVSGVKSTTRLVSQK